MSNRPDYDAGDLVVCVDASPRSWSRGNLLKRCGIYRIRSIYFWKDNEWAAVLEERLDAPEGFLAVRFRKVDPLPDALTSLLASKSVRERIDA